MEQPSEQLLQYIWQHRLYAAGPLKTIQGKSLVVQSPGRPNRDAGPDFEQSRLWMDGLEWVGTIEIHVKSSFWTRHGHHRDEAYNNVILHVVYEHDHDICLPDGTKPETLELKPLITRSLFDRYEKMMKGQAWIPCQQHLDRIEPAVWAGWLGRMQIERLECRARRMELLLKQTHDDWEEVSFQLLARGFGSHINGQAFQDLGDGLSYRLLLKYRNEPSKIEALLFGQAGMLSVASFQDDYPKALQTDYTYLRSLHHLVPMSASNWKFHRIRPMNFPTMRLAQLAAWCSRGESLFDGIISMQDWSNYKAFFSKLPVHEYWNNHYVFDRKTRFHGTSMGAQAIEGILLNTIVTILFSYGKYMGEEAYICRAVNLLEQLPSERNAVVRRFARLGVEVQSAGESQALLQLKHHYCQQFNCLNCSVGLQVFKQNRRL